MTTILKRLGQWRIQCRDSTVKFRQYRSELLRSVNGFQNLSKEKKAIIWALIFAQYLYQILTFY